MPDSFLAAVRAVDAAERLQTALRYAAAGWRVFPCRAGDKVPLFPNPHPKGSAERDTCRGDCGQVGHGVLDATTDADVIGGWWSRNPDANVGIATGTAGPDVVDIDVKPGRDGAASLARLRDAGLVSGAAATVRTPSGGLHIYFAGSKQRNGAMPRHGIDFRSCGGYVVAPPSLVDGRAYELIASRPSGASVDFAAIRRFLDPPPRIARPNFGQRADFDGLIRWVAGQGEGNRNNGLYWAARRAVENAADTAVFGQLVHAAVSAGLPSLEAERTVRSALRNGAQA